MDRLEAMNVFVTVAELRGFAPAARRLKVRPSTVTRMVAALEEHLGARLLQRTTRAVALTDAGARYLERARRVLGDVAEAEAAAQTERSQPTGRFSLAAPNLFGRLHVAGILSQYLALYPAVTGELTLSDRNANLVEDGIDAAVRIGVLEDSSLVARAVGATRRVTVAAPKYLSRHRAPVSPADLAGHALIQFTAIHPTPDWRFMVDGHESRIPYGPTYITNSADAAIGHALSANGIATVLAYQVIDAVRSGKLRVLLADFEPKPLPIHIVYPTTRLLSAKVRAFLELVSTACDWRFVDL
jgi:DNA-binding transcriptional LysR family regulator